MQGIAWEPTRETRSDATHQGVPWTDPWPKRTELLCMHEMISTERRKKCGQGMIHQIFSIVTTCKKKGKKKRKKRTWIKGRQIRKFGGQLSRRQGGGEGTSHLTIKMSMAGTGRQRILFARTNRRWGRGRVVPLLVRKRTVSNPTTA